MVVFGEDGQIKLEFVETIPKHLPCATDVCCSVEIACRGFSGRAGSVWFSRESITQFQADLRHLEATRQGAAALSDYSYGSEGAGVRIRLFTVDGWGHIAVQVEIRKSFSGRRTPSTQAATVEFEVDVERMIALVEDFETLLAPRIQ